MLTTTKLGIVFLMVISLAGTCFSQPETPKAPAEQRKYFQLNFVVKELEQGKVSNARAYSMMVATLDAPASIRSGSKVPMAVSTGSVNYFDVGVNIDCRAIKELQNQLALTVILEISSAAAEPAPTGSPLIRNTRWNSDVIVQIGKPTVIFSSDDPTTKRQLQLELTATPIK